MIQLIRIAVVAAFSLAATCASSSGSVGPVGVKPAVRADYSRGKAIVFRALVCRTCPIRKRAFNRMRAQELAQTLNAALEANPGRPVADNVRRICQTPEAAATRRRGKRAGAPATRADCAERIRLAKAYLDRRFRL